MTAVTVVLYPVSFVIDSGTARLVTLGPSTGTSLSAPLERTSDETARALLTHVLDDLASTAFTSAPTGTIDALRGLTGRYLALVGVEAKRDSTDLIYTASVPTPFAEDSIDITRGSTYAWRTINESRGRKPARVPERRTGADALVLDHWRQALEETDVALDFLPGHLTLLQLRSLYDAVWGYEQDPSGFKRWAVERSGAFKDLLDEVSGERAHELDEIFFSCLGSQLPARDAARAGSMVGTALVNLDASLRLPIAVAAASTLNRLHLRRGPEPTWYRKSPSWRQGPTWIRSLYPPRPAWTRWELGSHDDELI